MDPYQILGISRKADDGAVRKAYLELVRRFPPDVDPEAFKRISRAYEALKDEQARLKHYLFNKDAPGESPFSAFLNHISCTEKPTPMRFDRMKEFLRKCMI